MVEINADLLQDLTALTNQVNEAKQQIMQYATEHGQNIVRQVFQPLFDLGVKKATWNQYTPYFNDGEPCEFSVYDLYVTKDEDAPEDEHPEDENSWMSPYNLTYAFTEYKDPDLLGWQHYTPVRLAQMRANHEKRRQEILDQGWTPESAEAFFAAFKIADDFIHSNDDIMQMIFGDHVSVTVTPEEIISDNYDHD